MTTDTYRMAIGRLTCALPSAGERKAMNPDQRAARTAGLLYLVVIAAGIFSLAYVPSQIAVTGDASATVGHIVASESLFRLGIVAGLLCYTAFLLLPLALYKLLGPVNRSVAALMVALAVASVPISFVNLLNKLDILSLLGGADYLRAFTTEQLHARVMLSLDAYRNGLLVSKIFWGLWLLPFGYLVFKSGFLPRILGALLMAGCLSYLVDFTGRMLFAGYAETAIARFIMLPATIGEIGTCLWLLIAGTGRRARTMAAHAAQTQPLRDCDLTPAPGAGMPSPRIRPREQAE